MSQPRQQQNPPGHTSEMDPAPDHGETSYRGSGRLAGKASVITGADSGIGRAVAIAFAREGADVLVSYLDEDDDARETAKWIEDAGRRAVLVPGDVADPAHCRAVVEKAVQEFGRVDVLVLNAAFQMSYESLEEIPDEDWDRTLAVNLSAFFHMSKAAVPHMRAGSSIIGSSSVNSDMPSPNLMPYAMTKAGIANMSASLAQMLGPRGIRVNSVAPGPIWTPLIPSTMPPEKVEKFGSNTPLGRAGQPAEVAPAYVLLASDEARLHLRRAPSRDRRPADPLDPVHRLTGAAAGTTLRPVDDDFRLQRFVDAQDPAGTYAQVLAELRRGRKRSHWMWFVFPQVAGLGSSPTARAYAVSGLDEAHAYLAHPVLGPRLRECRAARGALPARPRRRCFGYRDALKLRSSMTLFALADPDEPVFRAVLDRYFDGAVDGATTSRALDPGSPSPLLARAVRTSAANGTATRPISSPPITAEPGRPKNDGVGEHRRAVRPQVQRGGRARRRGAGAVQRCSSADHDQRRHQQPAARSWSAGRPGPAAGPGSGRPTVQCPASTICGSRNTSHAASASARRPRPTAGPRAPACAPTTSAGQAIITQASGTTTGTPSSSGAERAGVGVGAERQPGVHPDRLGEQPAAAGDHEQHRGAARRRARRATSASDAAANTSTDGTVTSVRRVSGVSG